MGSTRLLLLLVVAATVATSPVEASFHLMQVEQVVGGVDGDDTIQAIQLRMRSSFQNQMQFSRVVAWDASGANPVVLSAPGTTVALHGAGVRVLIASAAFAARTTPVASPDFVMTNLIPASYLAAGSLTFEDNSGAVVYWRVSWGGGGYTGATTGSVTNDADGEFGPVYSGALPSTDTQALLFQGTATALSTNNAADYALSGANAVFTNNNGDAFTIETVTGVRTVSAGNRLLQNFPNPFSPTTEIEFVALENGAARLDVFDVRGRHVTTLLDRPVAAGPHRVSWQGLDRAGRRVSAGVYYYRLAMADFVESRRMVLIE